MKIFQKLNEPISEASVWHQLGRVYREAKQLQAAEQAYRHAVQIEESQGNLTRAATTWSDLALMNRYAGKPEVAEDWYCKAIEFDKKFGSQNNLAMNFNDLSDLLQDQPDRLSEAQKLAEAALAIRQTLDPSVTQIWQTYSILAKIAEKQEDINQARSYRRQAREAKAAHPGTNYELQKWGSLILTLHGLKPGGF